MQIRRRFYTDVLGIVIILILLSLIIFGTLVLFNTPERTRGSIRNEGPNGTSLFAGWLQDRGFEVQTLSTPEARPRGSDRLLFILAPRSGFTREQLIRLDNWVINGGTLVIAQESRQPSNLPRHFGAGIGRLWLTARDSTLTLPTLNWPPVGMAAINSSHYVSVSCGQVAVHMGDCRRPYLVAFGRGDGQVFIFSTVQPFTNEGITNAGNAQLVENLVLATTARNQRIIFDEVHHQLPFSWLFTTLPGWALWLTLALLAGFLIWHNSYLPTGRHKTKEAKGAATTYTKSTNDLSTASQQFRTDAALKYHYWQRLKRSLSRKYGLDPALTDSDLIEALKPLVDNKTLGTIVYLATHKEKFPPMANAELLQWVSVTIELTGNHALTREIYEHKKTI